MLNDLFINTLILIAFTFVGGNVIKEMPKSLTDKPYMKIVLGIAGGLLGCLMIYYKIQVPGTSVRLDLRALVFLMINYVSAGIPILVTGVIISIYRIVTGGIDESSMVAVIDILLFLTTFYLINKKVKMPWKNWLCKLLAILGILFLSIVFLLREKEDAYIVAISFVGVHLAAGTLQFFLLEYVRRSHELLRMYKESATKDYLTGLNNTRSFDKLLNSSFQNTLEKNERLSCLMIDIDHFKKVNDTYGHAVGDIVLKGLADILNKSCRNFDIIGRVGGEEFCVLLPDCSEERSFQIASRIKENVKKHQFDIGEDRFIQVTVSIGLATYPDKVEVLDELMKQADNALYKAKHEGRNRVCNDIRCLV